MKRKLTMSVLLLSILLITQLTAAVEVEGILIQGISDFYQGSYQQAVDVFNSLLAEDSDNIEAIYYQTRAQIKLFQLSQARENIQRLNELGYDFGILHWELGQVYLNREGKFDSPFYNEARNELSKAAALGISAPQFHRDLAAAYQGLGSLEKAAEHYSKALKDNGQAVDYVNLAGLYRETGQPEKAIDYYQLAVKAEPDNVSTYMSLGELYYEQGNYRQAVEQLEKGLNLDPSFTALRARLAAAYYQEGQLTPARREYEQVVRENKNYYQGYYYLGEIALDREKTALARSYYEKAVRYNPDYVRAYIALGKLALEDDDPYQAISRFTAAIEKNPQYPESHYHLARAYRKLGMNEAAAAELRKTLHLNDSFEAAREMLDEIEAEHDQGTGN